MKLNPDPSTTLFAVDLNKVLVKPDLKRMIWFALKHLKLSSFNLFFSYDFWYYILKNGAVPEKIIDKLHNKHSVKGITKSFLIKLTNIQILNTNLIFILETIKSNHYKLYIASNLWPEAFIDLRNKFPELKTIFDGYYIPTAKNNYIEKPDKLYFDDFKNHLSSQGQANKQVIFIDDKKENVVAAREQGFIGIEYKNINDLIKRLVHLGFKFLWQ